MIRPVAALTMSAALLILGPAGAASAMHPVPGPESMHSPGTSSTASGREGSAPSRSLSTGARADSADDMPVTIGSVSPSVIPNKGPIRMSGRVTNNTDALVSDINIHPLTSYAPLTTPEELAAATEADPEANWGERITDIGSFDTIDRLRPGQTKRWRLKIAPEHLNISRAEGVYQLGVHVRAPGTEAPGRVTYGRARTLIPLVDRRAKPVRTSIVLPVRHAVARDAEGRLEDSDAWEKTLATGGRLRNLTDFADQAGDLPLTWLIDPAVLDAARQMSTGNAARNLDPTDGEEPEIDSAEPELRTGSATAQSWLADLTDLTSGSDVLGLPYGDIDVAGAYRHSHSLYERARKMSLRSFNAFNISSRPVVAPPSGYLPHDALDLLDDTDVLLSSAAVPVEEGTSAADVPSYVDVDNHRITVHDGVAAATPEEQARSDVARPEEDTTDGPVEEGIDRSKTGDAQPSAVGVRQRVLSEAAVRSLSGSSESLVVNLPDDWDPGRNVKPFFNGIEQPFLDLVQLSGNGAGSTQQRKSLNYPTREQRDELPVNSFIAADGLVRAGTALDGILARTDQVARQVAAQALTSVSYEARTDPTDAQARSSSATARIRTLLSKVTIDAPAFVILSAESGPFAATVTNGLDQPVTVAIQAKAPNGVEIQAPEAVQLEANASRSVPLTARATSIGVHPVELVATDANGNPLGATDRLSVRSNAVGKVIWVIMAVGVGILFLAIGLRWVRRVRGGRSEQQE
ncbi:MAG: DUF6049 family protein [Nocardioides sp.]|nr:DUF6049 family protein [Nocardioides sp.]